MVIYNAQRDHLLGKPSIETEYCPFCGRSLYEDGVFVGNRHHLIQKGMGGTKLEKLIPTITVCGMGNASGCHGKLHQHLLETDWDDDADWYIYRYPKSIDSGWKPLRKEEPWII